MTSSCAYSIPILPKISTTATCSQQQQHISTSTCHLAHRLFVIAATTISVVTSPPSSCIASTITNVNKNLLEETVISETTTKKNTGKCINLYLSSSSSPSLNSMIKTPIYSSSSTSLLNKLKRSTNNDDNNDNGNNLRKVVRPNLSPAAEAELFTRLIVAILSGAIIGVERRAASASAGIRTLTLVSLGSAIFSLTALYGLGGDPARMGAAISTGIGFLGSGAINGQISGSRRQLVTAASIWVAAALGVASASGLFTLAIMCSFITIWILRWRLLLSILIISLRQIYIHPKIVQHFKAFQSKISQFLNKANLHAEKNRRPRQTGGKDDDR